MLVKTTVTKGRHSGCFIGSHARFWEMMSREASDCDQSLRGGEVRTVITESSVNRDDDLAKSNCYQDCRNRCRLEDACPAPGRLDSVQWSRSSDILYPLFSGVLFSVWLGKMRGVSVSGLLWQQYDDMICLCRPPRASPRSVAY